MFIYGLVITSLIMSACNDNELQNNEIEENKEVEDTEDMVDEAKEDDFAEEESEAKEGNEENNENNKVNEEHNEKEVVENIEPEYELTSDHRVVPVDDANERVVLLTIDDAPENYGAEMARILHELDAGAIFFVNGHFLKSEEGKEQLKEIHELGFEIGNHTMTHANLSHITEEEQINEIVELNDLVEEIVGERPRFFRAPFGVNTDTSKRVVEDEEMQWMNWTYGYDYFEEYMEADALAEIMVETELLLNGANLLMHDREFTKDALEEIVEGLRNKEYEIVDPALIK
ncbi:polysaccharide deacetylase family protein [Bacillus shivajii]|uniref:polysaccharide deacetylase family protein n=1 Tax=Bacillus shivajii TaxID=1983719 RepID=UPI001CFA7BBB|nr:polysaccharide deacetylase family protein [Bacillus shivajii]UCZ55339.1 polysaccharide deacetylase family protein [Bacillus shivajii]